MQRELQRMETLIGKILIVGVTLAGSIVAVGGVVYLLRHGGAQVPYHVFVGEPSDLTTIGGVIKDSLHASGRAIIQLGLIVLVAVQVVRVAFTVWLFQAAHDRAFMYISLTVFLVLAYSLLGQG
jgi:uncharacterized membrane protein